MYRNAMIRVGEQCRVKVPVSELMASKMAIYMDRRIFR